MDLDPSIQTLCSYREACHGEAFLQVKKDFNEIVGKNLSETYIDKINDIVREYIMDGKGSYCNLFTSAIDAFKESVKEYKIDLIPNSVVHIFQAAVGWREVGETGEQFDSLQDICPVVDIRQEFDRLLEQKQEHIFEQVKLPKYAISLRVDSLKSEIKNLNTEFQDLINEHLKFEKEISPIENTYKYNLLENQSKKYSIETSSNQDGLKGTILIMIGMGCLFARQKFKNLNKSPIANLMLLWGGIGTMVIGGFHFMGNSSKV